MQGSQLLLCAAAAAADVIRIIVAPATTGTAFMTVVPIADIMRTANHLATPTSTHPSATAVSSADARTGISAPPGVDAPSGLYVSYASHAGAGAPAGRTGNEHAALQPRSALVQDRVHVGVHVV